MAIHAAGAAAVKRLVQQGHSVPVSSASRGDRVTDCHSWQGAEFFFDFAAAFFCLLGFAGIGKWRRSAGGDIPEVLFGHRKTFFGFHVAKNEEHGIVRRVVRFEKGLHVGETGGIEISKISIKIVGVGPIAKGDGRKIEPGKAAVRLVQDIDADFFFDYIALIAEILVVDLEGAHAVGFEPKNTLERVGGHRLEIIGDIVMRRAVERAAAGIDELDVLHLGSVGGALEHHVLEEMREAAAALRLETETNFIVDAYGDDGGSRVWRNNYFESIGKCGR